MDPSTRPPTIVIASKSPGKLREIRDALSGIPVEVRSLVDVGWEDEVAETGTTFEENAVLKAETVAIELGCAVLADDSGLEVEALGWGPGVYSARFAGPEATDDDRNVELVRRLQESASRPPWTARYRCILAFARPLQETVTFDGTFCGEIIAEPRGSGGFGYDPHFLLADRGLTVGEIALEEKQKISHRGLALAQFTQWLAETEL